MLGLCLAVGVGIFFGDSNVQGGSNNMHEVPVASLCVLIPWGAYRPHERSADELRRLANFLSQEVPWFAGFTKQMVTEVRSGRAGQMAHMPSGSRARDRPMSWCAGCG
jgi:hypothetical protein